MKIKTVINLHFGGLQCNSVLMLKKGEKMCKDLLIIDELNVL